MDLHDSVPIVLSSPPEIVTFVEFVLTVLPVPPLIVENKLSAATELLFETLTDVPFAFDACLMMLISEIRCHVE